MKGLQSIRLQLSRFKASKTLLGIETDITTPNKASGTQLSFKASKTLLGIETLPANSLDLIPAASKPLKPF